MKRLTSLVLALCLVLGAASRVSAIEVKPSGVMDFVFCYSTSGLDKNAFQDDKEFDRFSAKQRSRIQVDFIANENLRGVIMLQFGTWEWGRGNGALDTTREGDKVRRLYLDFNFPDSPVNVKMGLMDLRLPYATFGQPAFGNHVAAVTASVNLTDKASLTAFWARPYRNSSASELKDNDMDVFGLWTNLDFESFTLAPWAAYSRIGTNSGWFKREYGVDSNAVYNYTNPANGDSLRLAMERDRADWWGLGLALKAMPTDSLTIKFDAMYASLKTDGEVAMSGSEGGVPFAATVDSPRARGYYFALAVDYALDWGKPGLFAIYSSGDDAEDGKDALKSGRLPGLGYDDKVSATRMAMAGSMTLSNDAYVTISGLGMWLVGAQVADLSFAENMTHVARLAYLRGTNHIDSNFLYGTRGGKNYGAMIPLAHEDQAWEVGFDTYWKMRQNLTVGLELGYMYLDATSRDKRDDLYNKDSIFSGNLIFRYGF